ncbi:glycosyltransferase family 2 protein [Aneurinibacillus danicus]|uniref:Glycosyltransferase 2-like domain-containing protein n=1 Tax=Aneurinibacillus danicus TaxID=267746 RepID=A0A511VFJ0_9BACL|nr:glycosyltransferase family 2 protein [Aneurinibacillus danicus]GEN36728.1 hypothetical protein ADA01nite_41880 [Aneurinibacillus danicus]
MKITIFTPTYNRAHTLSRLYNSIKNQIFTDFEWIIVDDGSIDSTNQLVQKFINEDKVDIKYLFLENGGKHRAIKKGLEFARGELFFIVDSDDHLLKNSLEKIWNVWEGLDKQKRKYAGVAGLRGYDEKNIIGNTFQGVYLDADSIDFRYIYNIKGDKAEVIRTELLREVNIPEYSGEKFLTEAVFWNEIASRGYKFRWFNDIIYICDYQSDGLSANYRNLLIESWRGTCKYFVDLLNSNKIPRDIKLNVILEEYLNLCFVSQKPKEEIVGGLLYLTSNPIFNEIMDMIEQRVILHNSVKSNFDLYVFWEEKEREWLKRGIKSIVIYGGGEHTDRLLRYLNFKNINICGIADSNVNLIGKEIGGYKINNIESYYSNSLDLVLISSFKFENEIFEQLSECFQGKKTKIYRLYHENPDVKMSIYGQLYWNNEVKK